MTILFQMNIQVIANQFLLLTIFSALLLILGIIFWGFNRDKVVAGAIYAWVIVFTILTLSNGLLYYIGYSINLVPSDFYVVLTVVGVLLFFELGVMVYLGVDPLILGLNVMALIFLGVSITIFYYEFASNYVLSFFFLSILLGIASLDIWGAAWLRNKSISEQVRKTRREALRTRETASSMREESERKERELEYIDTEAEKTKSGLEKAREERRR